MKIDRNTANKIIDLLSDIFNWKLDIFKPNVSFNKDDFDYYKIGFDTRVGGGDILIQIRATNLKGNIYERWFSFGDVLPQFHIDCQQFHSSIEKEINKKFALNIMLV